MFLVTTFVVTNKLVTRMFVIEYQYWGKYKMHEFEIINSFFKDQQAAQSDVVLGVGDDCAIVDVPSNKQLAITTDTLNADVHFFADVHPADLGHKALAVSLSDLASMGAEPKWVTLNLSMTKSDEKWLREFSAGFFALAKKHNVSLIGGDLTSGPLSVTVQGLGLLPSGKKLTRSGAKVSDLIVVTGELGDAGLALKYLQKELLLDEKTGEKVLAKLNRPEPQCEVGQKLLDSASSCIDISDGLAADLEHILDNSKVGAEIFINDIPISNELKNTLPVEQALKLALTAGDDYHLCFTVPESKKTELEKLNIKCFQIGKIVEGKELIIYDQENNPIKLTSTGYQHF